jgi:putative membrane protein
VEAPLLDLILAILHHLLIFGIFGIIVFELVSVKKGMDAASVRRVAAVDAWYGISALLILIIGFSRAVFAAKGWFYYMHNLFFWAKLTTFMLIGLLSVRPTIRILKWKNAGGVPRDIEVKIVRLFIHLEAALFPLLLIFAAAMARGYGETIPK